MPDRLAPQPPRDATDAGPAQPAPAKEPTVPERDGAPGPEPTRYGDWERRGVAVDF